MKETRTFIGSFVVNKGNSVDYYILDCVLRVRTGFRHCVFWMVNSPILNYKENEMNRRVEVKKKK